MQKYLDTDKAFSERVRVITTENGGAANARNRGIREAGGKYLAFVDQDDFIAKDPKLTIDYIHGERDTRELCASGDAVGMLLEPLDKFSLFPGIRAGGHLPRKTFSMGEAREKRYYMECRKLR